MSAIMQLKESRSWLGRSPSSTLNLDGVARKGCPLGDATKRVRSASGLESHDQNEATNNFFCSTSRSHRNNASFKRIFSPNPQRHCSLFVSEVWIQTRLSTKERGKVGSEGSGAGHGLLYLYLTKGSSLKRFYQR